MSKFIFLRLWLAFLLGAVIHVLKRGRFSVRSKQYPNIDAWFLVFWDVILVRTILGGVVFALWYRSAGQFIAPLLKLIGVQVTIPEIPVNASTSVLFGYFVDSILDWACQRIPYLRKEIPQFNGLNNGAAKAAADSQ